MQMLIAVILGGLGLGLLVAGARGKSGNVLGVLEGGQGLAGLQVGGGQVIKGHGSIAPGTTLPGGRVVGADGNPAHATNPTTGARHLPTLTSAANNTPGVIV